MNSIHQISGAEHAWILGNIHERMKIPWQDLCRGLYLIMGAHIRAYRFLCFQTQLGYRPNDPITLDEVSEVIPMIIQQGWLKSRPRSDYEEYLSGGNLHKIADGFRGKSRMRALWDITGYALQGWNVDKSTYGGNVRLSTGYLLEYEGTNCHSYTPRYRRRRYFVPSVRHS